MRYDKETEASADVLVLGGGLAGCFAAIAAARQGASVILVDKSCVAHSGAAGAGVDHWMDCPANPASTVDPETYARSLIDDFRGGFDNGIATFITAKDSYDVLLELEQMGVKIRDTGDEFQGADFRDEATIVHSCLARKASSGWFGFARLDYPKRDPPEWRKWVTVQLENDQVAVNKLALDYYGSLEDNYAMHGKQTMEAR
ncbi:MAG: FAD-dependent oxidoreductase [Anaerolineae bacterium]|nr:FAD-dependent oxidoreductase [Anaerolineae bacterium]